VVRYDENLPTFVRGDADGNGVVNITDPFAMLQFMFLGIGPPDCELALDVTSDHSIRTDDPVALLLHLFQGSVAPAPPFPDCGRLGGFLRHDLPCERSTCTP
jgi:hypothetical protein